MVREACCRNSYGRYMGSGCWDAVMDDAANADESREPSRVQQLGSAATVRDVVQIHTEAVAQGWSSSGNSHVVDLEGAEMDGDKAVELEHLGCKASLRAWAANVEVQITFSDVCESTHWRSSCQRGLTSNNVGEGVSERVELEV